MASIIGGIGLLLLLASLVTIVMIVVIAIFLNAPFPLNVAVLIAGIGGIMSLIGYLMEEI